MENIPNHIKQKLDAFLRRYYSLKLLKGAILGLGLLAVYFLILSGLELLLHMPTLARMVLFYSFLLLGALVVGFYLIWPIMQLLRIGRVMSYQEAARLIGRHFGEIDDKLLNLLQLQETTTVDDALIAASIEQRAKKLSPFDFSKALELRSALRFWPLLALPILLVLVLSIGGVVKDLTEASGRVMRYSEDFRPSFPFEVDILSEASVERGANYTLQVKFNGEALPEEMLLLSNGRTIRLINRGEGLFEHTYTPFAQSQDIAFQYGDIQSALYHLEVLDVPQLVDFIVEIDPPAYTGFSERVQAVENVLDVPEGSQLRFIAKASFTDQLYMRLSGDSALAFSKESERRSLELLSLKRDMTYRIVGVSDVGSKQLSPENSIHVLKDRFPTIKAEWVADSVNPNKVYYRFEAEDDYGIGRVRLVLESGGREVSNETAVTEGSVTNKGGYGYVDLSELVEQSDFVEVYLKVYDNDAVNGSKSSKSNIYSTKALSKQDYQRYLDRQLGETSAEKAKMNEALRKQNEQLGKQLNKLRRGEYDWKDKKELNELLKKEQDILKKKKELEKRQEELRKEREKEKTEDIRNSKKEEELQKLLDEIQKLKDKLGIEELQKKLEKLQELTEQMSQQEARQQKLEEQLESERSILEAIDKLQELSEQQKALSEEEANSKEEKVAQDEEQERLQKAFEEVEKEIKQQMEENKRFDQAAQKEQVEQKSDQAASDMQKAGAEQNQSKAKKGAQKKASESLQEFAEGLQNAFMAMQAQGDAEDAEMLRRILENVEQLSFGSEFVLERSKQIQGEDPLVRKLLIEQNRLIVGTKVIKDSLTALANRNPKIQQKVFEELGAIETNQARSLDEMQNLSLSASAGHQQYVMLAANNLALMLDASLQNMMQQMANQKPGNQNCQKPGGAKPSKSGLAKMQSELGQQMQKRMQGKQKGKEGSQGKDGEQGDAGELARIISQQEQLRQAYQQQKEAERGGGGTGDKEMEHLLEEVERDLYNDRITPETLERVREIESRLLEDERAERKQEQDEQRQSESAKPKTQEGAQVLEFLKQKAKLRENLLFEELILREQYRRNP